MAAYSSILVWEMPWTEPPGGRGAMGSQRVGQDRVTEHTVLSPKFSVAVIMSWLQQVYFFFFFLADFCWL